jgi:hypothetical protein
MTGGTSSSWIIEVWAEPAGVLLRAERAEQDHDLRSFSSNVADAVDRLAGWLRVAPRGNFEIVVACGDERRTHSTTSASIALHFVVNALENLVLSPPKLAAISDTTAQKPATHVHAIAGGDTSEEYKVVVAE